MSDTVFNSMVAEVDSFSYSQCITLLGKLYEVLNTWSSKTSDAGEELFYSEKNMAHLRRGVEALNSGKGIEHELIEV